MGKPADGNSAANGERPRGDDIGPVGATPVIDPTTIEPAAGSSAGPGKRGRGRPRKDGSTPAAASAPKPARAKKETLSPALDVGTLTLIVSFAGGIVSARNKALALDDDEAGQIAEAAANVGKHYNVPISPLQQAWVALGMTVGSIYAGKIMAMRVARTMKNAAPAAHVNGASAHETNVNFDFQGARPPH